MTTIMYNEDINTLLVLEDGLWFNSEIDSSPLYRTKMIADFGEFLVEDNFENMYKAAVSRGYKKIGVL